MTALENRASQILPTVKCSSCGVPVEFRKLGEHVCSSAPPIPSIPAIHKKTTSNGEYMMAWALSKHHVYALMWASTAICFCCDSYCVVLLVLIGTLLTQGHPQYLHCPCDMHNADCGQCLFTRGCAQRRCEHGQDLDLDLFRI